MCSTISISGCSFKDVVSDVITVALRDKQTRRERETKPNLLLQTTFVLQGALELTDNSQNSRLGSSLAEIPDMNGDGFRELVVGAPLEDSHQGAVYVFYGQGKTIQRRYRQVRAAGRGTLSREMMNH